MKTMRLAKQLFWKAALGNIQIKQFSTFLSQIGQAKKIWSNDFYPVRRITTGDKLVGHDDNNHALESSASTLPKLHSWLSNRPLVKKLVKDGAISVGVMEDNISFLCETKEAVLQQNINTKTCLLNGSQPTSEEALNIAYVVNSLMTQHRLQGRSWQKIREKLQFAKLILENYMENASSGKFKFASLEKSDKHTELKKHHYFHETYTTTLNNISKTYRDDIEATPQELDMGAVYLNLFLDLSRRQSEIQDNNQLDVIGNAATFETGGAVETPNET
jgi:hypothetical protein